MQPELPESVRGREAFRIQLKITLELARGLAEDFRRLSAFEQESREWGFKDAARTYSRALWRWIMDQTSDALLKEINKLVPTHFKLPDDDENWHDITVLKFEYLLRRALFLSGLQYEKAHDAEWYRSFVRELYIADKLADLGVFDAIATAKQRRRLKKTAGWGHLRYNVLRGWLAGGLWKLPSDRKRVETFNQLLGGGSEVATEAGFAKARQRLGLD